MPQQAFSQSNPSFVIDTSCNPIEIILAIEEAEGFDYPVSIYSWIDSIQNLSIDTHKISLFGQLFQVNQHFKSQATQAKSYLGTLGQCLQYKYFDCDILSLLMLSYFEVKTKNLCGFWNEKHMWIGDCEDMNQQWETTTLKNESINHYYKKYSVPDNFEHESNYYKALSKKDYMAWAYFQLGSKQLALANYDLALKYCFKALSFSDNWPKAYELLGDAYFQQKDFNKAEIAYYQAYSLFKKDEKIKEKIIGVYQQLGCLEEIVLIAK